MHPSTYISRGKTLLVAMHLIKSSCKLRSSNSPMPNSDLYYAYPLNLFTNFKNQQDLCAEHMKLLIRREMHKLLLRGWPPKGNRREMLKSKSQVYWHHMDVMTILRWYNFLFTEEIMYHSYPFKYVSMVVFPHSWDVHSKHCSHQRIHRQRNSSRT